MKPAILLALSGSRGRAVFVASLLAAPLAACTGGDHRSSTTSVEPAASASDPTPAAAPDPSPVRAAVAPVTGTIAETMEAASYTYVRLTTPQGEQWAAIPQAKVAVGDTVTIENPMVIDGFKSPTLKRSFEHILFGTLAGRPSPMQSAAAARGANPHAGMPAMAGMPGAPVAAEAPLGPPVAKATGANAHTIAELFASKGTVKDQPVTVRGRVTKFNAAIMGKNWVHIEDGSGKGAADGNLVVTTKDIASVGDVVVVQGTVRTDKDFGAGYSYALIVEDATVAK